MNPELLSHTFLCSYTERDLPSAPDQAHVWRIGLDLEAERIAALEGLLSPEERARAARFHSASDRRRFVAARGSLRAILAQYLGMEPRQVRIAYTPEGKPILAGDDLRFNLSHSDALALLAVTLRRAVGIDVERLRTDFDPDSLARRFFAPSELAALSQAPPAEKHQAFLRIWTLKEAYLKAVGTGLSAPLNRFAVSLEDDCVRLIGPAGGAAAAPYRLRPLDAAPGYVAALALALDPEG